MERCWQNFRYLYSFNGVIESIILAHAGFIDLGAHGCRMRVLERDSHLLPQVSKHMNALCTTMVEERCE